MANVPRYRASRFGRRLPDRESSADRDRPEDVSLLKLAQIIGQDETFLAVGRDAALRRAPPAEEAWGAPPDDDRLDHDWPEFDADDAIVDSRRGWFAQPPASAPARPDWDDRDAPEGRTVGAQRFAPDREGATRPPQLGHALSELARLVGQIDSFLAAPSSRTPTNAPDREEPRTTGGRRTSRDNVDDDEVTDIELPVPSRHAPLTDDVDDPGLSLYAPRRKGRAAFAVGRTDQPNDLYGASRRAADDPSGGAQSRAPGYAPPRGGGQTADDRGDDHHTRRQRWRPPPTAAPPRRRGGRLLTVTAFLVLTATATLYGYRAWTDPGSGHPGPIAAEAAPAMATGDSLERSAVENPTNLGQGVPIVLPDPALLLAPATIGAPSRTSPTGESTGAGTTTRPRRHDEHRAHRTPAGAIAPIANDTVSASTTFVLPCDVGVTRTGC
jgi:hypothetical protein